MTGKDQERGSILNYSVNSFNETNHRYHPSHLLLQPGTSRAASMPNMRKAMGV
jgi:hypothetical protein